MTKVLLSGASGFLGNQTLESLSAEGHEIHAVSRRPRQDHRAMWHGCDLLDEEAVSRLMNAVRPEAVIHLAWDVEPPDYWQSATNLAWRKATLHLFEEGVANDMVSFVGAGTCGEYQASTHALQENAAGVASPAYGRTKFETGEELVSRGESCGVDVAWGRIFYPYGPGERSDRLIPSIVASFLQSETSGVRHPGRWIDPIHSADVARAFVLLLDGNVTGAINIGSGRKSTLEEIAARIASILGITHLRAELGPEGERGWLADIGRLKKLGFRPTWSLGEGLAQEVSWWRSRLEGVK